MKKIFPLIVVLITLSVVGILVIQMSWIQNAIKLKNEEFLRGVDNALKQTKQAFYDRFIVKSKTYIPDDDSKLYFLQNNFRMDGVFTQDEVRDIIENKLRQNNIKEPF